MKAAVLQFPGSNCDQDCAIALSQLGASVTMTWHKDAALTGYDLIVVPGGFSFGDYLRCGAIAQFSPVMQTLKSEAERGTKIIGICNGFQILCEAGLLPGALIRNRGMHFICEHVHLKVERADTAFTSNCQPGEILHIPIAHGEGSYFADSETLAALEDEGRVLVRYATAAGEITDAANPNGAVNNIAGILNEAGNVFGLMPHPERACEPRLGSTDGNKIFTSILQG